ncbi:penicillin-binding protein [Bacillus sp. M6-12]|uniref:serine hydrolase domain-containing protein n=1 Tax=Bacillus sp. M6-12 TaxID=2054166 RepID=UPI000C794B94|nr:serine hydrolase domain-containing protein [Bacillus sp. M6-12]PLS18519.1 penicillin-binding protein [Bacillus sp. M6-12]
MSDMRDKLKHYMDTLGDNNHFNGTVLIGYQDRILFKGGYGSSSFQYAIPNTPETIFRVGSITKAFTAMAILLLHEQGSLNIEDTVSVFLPDFPNGDRITIHQLMTHTSGVKNFTANSDYWSTRMRLPFTLEETIDSFKEPPLGFNPGTKMDYSNSGYILLTAIIEKAAQMPYADFLKKWIFIKLGLANTGVDNGRTIIKGLATGHTVWEDVIHTSFIDMTFPLGAYGIYSCVEDLFKWSRALVKYQLLPKELQDRMFCGFEKGYGYGWAIEEGSGKVVPGILAILMASLTILTCI